ncbi:DUF5995 family protein [Nocardioides yefusunii]|uniref:DUF5995 family protein n=1 Tax=Nocardioides yefusunii TaxID=2500546 RepID=A0ABW1QVV7_9ACTN|nr:DUF5995 family protein [Nocardioides yefusunii]
MTSLAMVLGWGCAAPASAALFTAPGTQRPATTSACAPTLSGAENSALLAAASPTGLSTISDVKQRLATVNSILAARGDARGTFPLVYEVIVDETIASLDAGIFTHRAWAEQLAVSFAAEYFRNLDAHLRGRTTLTTLTTYWRDYYRLAADCTRSPGRIVGQGIINHLVDDLPRTLKAVGTTTGHRADYDLYGTALVTATPQIIETFQAHYDVDLSGLFQLYFVGNVVGSQNVTTAFFTSVRTLAWNNFTTLRLSTLLGTTSIAGAVAAGSGAVAALELAGGL